MYYTRAQWGARATRGNPGYRNVGNEATIHWSGSKETDAGVRAGSAEALPPKPKKPGLKWYKLWRDPDSPKAVRRNISRVIRKYNKSMREWTAATRDLDAPVSPEIVSEEKRIMHVFQNYHMDTHGWSDIGYHFVIFASGNYYEGRPLSLVGAHAYNANHTTGICLVMGPGDTATVQMLGTLFGLIKAQKITRYRGHRQVPGNATECPGDYLIKILSLPVGY